MAACFLFFRPFHACVRRRFSAVFDAHRKMKNGQLTDAQRPSFGFRYSFGESHGFSKSEETQLISEAIITHDLGLQGATLPESQGIRIFLGENSLEIASFSTRSFTFGSDTDFGAFLYAK